MKCVYDYYEIVHICSTVNEYFMNNTASPQISQTEIVYYNIHTDMNSSPFSVDIHVLFE